MRAGLKTASTHSKVAIICEVHEMTKWISTGVVICGLLVAGASLQAHHSLAGMYALGKEAKVTGAFKAFRLVNPHSSLKLEVKGPQGDIVEWSFVGGSVQQLEMQTQDRFSDLRSRLSDA